MLVFQDESAVRLLPSVARSYAPIGRPPLLECDVKNKDFVSISGAMGSNGSFYYEVREKEGFKQKGLTRFLSNCRKRMRKNLLMLWDNASSHKSETVKEFLVSQDAGSPAIWLENIPPYSPELNPIEQVWGYLKKQLANRFFINTSELKKAVILELDKIKKDKKLIASFFKNEELKCYQFF